MDYLKFLEKEGVILKGHFLLTSGLHSDTYFEKFRLIEKPFLLSRLLKKLLEGLEDIDWVVGPVVGGAIIAFESARILKCRAAFSEKTENGMVLKRGFDIKEDEKIIVVDDVLTTGKSITGTLNALKGKNISGIYVLIDRSENNINLNYPLKSLIKYPVINYKPEDCPLCKKNIPLIRRGG
uniref:Orotate phosphoribosyltransferase n=1 Tax=candidate division WOR-3 bacterium TaxID=2052148 RepID=A0A7C4YGH6_UNCW3